MIPTSEQNTSDGEREAEIATAGDTPLGACVYLTPDQLRALGIDPEDTDAVGYEVDEDAQRLIIEPVGGDD